MTWSDQRVLVTGGAGFIGSHLVERLEQTNSDIYVLDNFFAGREDHLPASVAWDDVDLRDRERTVAAITEFNPTSIVHLGAIHHIPYCNAHPEETFDVNVMGTRNVLAAARDLPALSGLMYTSSAAVYPPKKQALPENTTPGPIDIYGRTKLVGEDLVREFQRETDIPSVTARLFNVYGPNETNMHLSQR